MSALPRPQIGKRGKRMRGRTRHPRDHQAGGTAAPSLPLEGRAIAYGDFPLSASRSLSLGLPEARPEGSAPLPHRVGARRGASGAAGAPLPRRSGERCHGKAVTVRGSTIICNCPALAGEKAEIGILAACPPKPERRRPQPGAGFCKRGDRKAPCRRHFCSRLHRMKTHYIALIHKEPESGSRSRMCPA